MIKNIFGKLKERKSALVYLLVLIMLFNSIIPRSVFAAEENLNIAAGVQVAKTVSKTVIDLMDPVSGSNQLRLNYTVSFDDIPENLVNRGSDKELVLIIDTSGSMEDGLGGPKYNKNDKLIIPPLKDQRMTIVKAAANSFLDKLSADNKLKISLIDFNNRASVHTFNNNTLVNLSSNLTTVKDRINGLTPDGGTNIGDALRRANEILDTSSTAEKYVVFLSDGEPTAFSFSQLSYYSGNEYNATGFFQSGTSQVYTQGIYSAEHNYGTGVSTKYYVNYGTNYDSGGHSKAYAKNMTKVLEDNGIDAHYIGFTLSDNAANNILHSNLQDPHYYTAITAEDINQVYQNIADQIVSEISIPSMRFEEILPANVSVVDLPSGFVSQGQNIAKDFGEVVFSYNASKKAFEAQDITFSIVVSPQKEGVYEFGKNNTSKMVYTDINQAVKSIYFPSSTLTAIGELSDHRSIKVLEVQPQFLFELEESKLQSAFSDYKVTLHQLSMSQFVGMIDELNGLYDI
ncbi:MAG: VWA domain-containing protein, partial [Vallitaleaceae bacterium]|nr:VWA domain-containing protein [Vallitaleaceae bacterium]